MCDFVRERAAASAQYHWPLAGWERQMASVENILAIEAALAELREFLGERVSAADAGPGLFSAFDRRGEPDC